MQPAIIGLLGRSRAGKDTVAETLCSLYPHYQIVRLSAPFKQAACHLYDFTMDQVEGPGKEQFDPRWNRTPREAIQSLTDYMMYYMGKDFFTKKLYHAYDTKQTSPYIIIPDIRYEHDIQEIQKRKGLVIKIERPHHPIKHPFENHIDQLSADFTLINQGSREEFIQLINQNAKNSWFVG